jgi:hypothetical protein
MSRSEGLALSHHLLDQKRGNPLLPYLACSTWNLEMGGRQSDLVSRLEGWSGRGALGLNGSLPVDGSKEVGFGAANLPWRSERSLSTVGEP